LLAITFAACEQPGSIVLPRIVIPCETDRQCSFLRDGDGNPYGCFDGECQPGGPGDEDDGNEDDEDGQDWDGSPGDDDDGQDWDGGEGDGHAGEHDECEGLEESELLPCECYRTPEPYPVCGIDGVTYFDACEAELLGIEIAYMGPCPICSGDEECNLHEEGDPAGSELAGRCVDGQCVYE
jgi:hypothetical protein